MGVFDSNLGVVKDSLSARGIPSVRSLSDILNERRYVMPAAGRTLPAPPDLTQARGGGGQKPGGWEGFISGLTGGFPGKLITNPLTVLGVPGKIIPSIAKELKDAWDNDPNTQASWGELVGQLTDPNFGFGTVTGNLTGLKWVDRAIGLAGDIFLDPLTYATLGANKAVRAVDAAGNVIKGKKTLSIATREGRFAMAEKFRELGADDLTVKNILRRGRAAVADKDMLAKAGYDRAGIYWMGMRVPGTTRAGEALEGALTSFRVWTGDHIFNRVGELFTPLDAMDARRILARGSAPTDKVGDLMTLVLGRNEERAVEQASMRQAGQLRLKNFGTVSPEDLKASRSTAYKYIDVNGPQINLATPEGRVASATRAWLDELHKNVEVAAKDLDPEFNLNYINNYLPYMIKDDAWRWMENTNNPRATLAKGQTFDVFEPTGAFKSRRIAGDTIGKHKLTQADIDGGIDRINDIYRKEFDLNFDFFETDLPTIITKYEAMYAGMMGKIARKKFMADRGTFKRLDDLLVTDPELDKITQKQLQKIVRERTKRQKASSTALTKVTDTISSILDGSAARISADINDISRRYGDSLMQEGALSYQKSVIVKNLDEARDELRESFNLFQRSIEGAKDNVIIQTMDNRIEALLDRMDNLADDVRAINFADSSQQSQMKSIADEIKSINKKIAETMDSEQSLIERGNVVAGYLSDILSGKDVEGYEQLSRDIRDSIKGNIAPPRGAESTVQGEPRFRDALKGLEGPERELKVQELRKQGMYTGIVNESWWAEIQKLSPISASKVENYATKKNIVSYLQTIARGGGDKGKNGSTASIEELRAVGVALVGWIDTLPEDMASKFAGLREDLIEGIKQASQSANYYKKLAKARTGNNGVVTLGAVIDNYDNVVSNARQYFFRYFAADDLLKRVFSNVELGAKGDQVVPTALIQRIVSEPEFRSLVDDFEPILAKRTDRSVNSFDEIESLMGASYGYEGALSKGTVVGGRYADGGDFVQTNHQCLSKVWNQHDL